MSEIRDGAPPPGWNCNKERLLCLTVLDDSFANLLSTDAGEAFFRAFIVMDRETGHVRINFRWRYSDSDQWCQVAASREMNATEAFNSFRDGIEIMLRKAAALAGHPLPAKGVHHFEPPDDGGEFQGTLDWLNERDLLHEPRIQKSDCEARHD